MGTWVLDNVMAQSHPGSPGLPASLTQASLLFRPVTWVSDVYTDLLCTGRAGLPRSAWPLRSVLDTSRDVFTVLTTVGPQAHYSKLEQGSWGTGAGQGNWRLLPSHLSRHGLLSGSVWAHQVFDVGVFVFEFLIPSLQTRFLAHPSQDQNH